jgi:hypothetical protein
MNPNFHFTKNRPDDLAEQLAALLTKTQPLAFSALFEKLQAELVSKGLRADGDMLRLRAHEKLQKFLLAGLVTKNGKEYTGVPAALSNFLKTATEQKAHSEGIKQKRATPQSAENESINIQPSSQRTKASTKPARKRG